MFYVTYIDTQTYNIERTCTYTVCTTLKDEYGDCEMSPRVDGDFIPDTAGNLRERGEYNIVPEMIGLNRHDSFIYFVFSKS